MEEVYGRAFTAFSTQAREQGVYKTELNAKTQIDRGAPRTRFGALGWPQDSGDNRRAGRKGI